MSSKEIQTERGGAAIILHSGGQVLLQKRGGDAPRWPLMWGVFGGNFFGGESPEDAAIREVKEELGIAVPMSSLKFVHSAVVHVGERSGLAHYFSSALTVPLSDIRLTEGVGFALFEHSEIDQLSLIPHAREALVKFFEDSNPQ